jgi:hypothetical protein
MLQAPDVACGDLACRFGRIYYYVQREYKKSKEMVNNK